MFFILSFFLTVFCCRACCDLQVPGGHSFGKNFEREM